jgi:hypothetical protein
VIFVDNLPPCLKGNPDYPGIKPPFETRGESSNPPSAQKVTTPCDQCGQWLERYYLDIPKLQSKIQDLENQVAKLTGRNDKGQLMIKINGPQGRSCLKTLSLQPRLLIPS